MGPKRHPRRSPEKCRNHSIYCRFGTFRVSSRGSKREPKREPIGSKRVRNALEFGGLFGCPKSAIIVIFTVIQAFRARLQKLLFLMFLERAKCQNDSKYNWFQHFWEPSKGDPWRGFLGTLGLKGRLLFFPKII